MRQSSRGRGERFSQANAYLGGHGGDPAQGEGPCEDVLAKAGVLRVL